MDRIIEGVQHFQNAVYPQKRALFERLAKGQQPDTLMVTCSDSRISPELITQAPPGELFVCRNAGNIVPSSGCTDAMCATVEYALAALPVHDIVVCGHSDCGAMKGLLTPQKLSAMPHVQSWLTHARGAMLALEQDGVSPQAQEALKTVTKLNIRLQLQHLQTYAQVFAKIREGSLRLHGWYYEIGSGEVEVWEPAEDSWISLRDIVAVTPMRRRAAGSQEVRHA